MSYNPGVIMVSYIQGSQIQYLNCKIVHRIYES